MNRRLLPVSAVSIACLLLGTVALVAGPPNQKTQTAKKTATTAKTSSPASAADSAAVSVAVISVNGVNDIDPTKAYGSKKAPVIMEVFSDFQCPACKQLFTTTTQKVMDNYVNSGKIYIIHRDFPLPMHAYSRIAASYARAAAHIGKGEVVENALFQNQAQWEADGKVKETVASVLSPGEMKRVQAIVDARTLEPMIEKDKQIGQVVPVNQTPTTILHTKTGQTFPVVGFVNYDVLKTFLDQLVAQK